MVTRDTVQVVGPALSKMLAHCPHAVEKRNGWYANPDNPTFDFREQEDGSITINSWTGRSDANILHAIGLTLSDIRPMGYKTVKAYSSIDLLQLAYAKRIHWRFLEELGLLDEYPYHRRKGIYIPYFFADGRENTKKRVRVSIDTPRIGKKQYWDENTPGDIIPYGLDRLGMAHMKGWLLIGEGESDRWACLLHDVPYLGIPGATLQKSLIGVNLNDIPKLYIIVEPDQMTRLKSKDEKSFYEATHQKLRDEGYTGEIFCIDFKTATGHKDPSALHIHLFDAQQTDQFTTIIEQAIEQAIPANDYEPTETTQADSIYISRPDGMYARMEDKRKGEVYNVQLSNFGARIIADVITDDGAETKRSYEMQATIAGKNKTFEIPAKSFNSLGWIDENLGARAYISPGKSIASHFCNAVKETSQAEEHHYYAHTGWVKIDGTTVYLHNGGVIGYSDDMPVSTVSTSAEQKNRVDTENSVSDTACRATLDNTMSTLSTLSTNLKGVSVKLTGSLENYHLKKGDMPLAQAVRASLDYVDLASDTITMPLYASLWRSVLPQVNYYVHITGETGLGKSELAALLQQHFGRAMHAKNFPAAWESSANSLEMTCFQVKDAITVVDEFKPNGTQSQLNQWHSKADRVLRSVGNGSYRGRLDGNLNQRVGRQPRSLLLSTGEDTPKGQSLQARGVILTMDEKITEANSPASQRLKAAQAQARAGVYETAMYGYIEWLAPRIDELESNLQGLLETERDSLHFGGHGRLETNTANMLLGFKTFLQFAQDCEAITAEEARELLTRCTIALSKVAHTAVDENAGNKPSEQYRRLLVAALRAGTAHLTTLGGGCPGTAYGWKTHERAFTNSAGESVPDATYIPCGDMIGAIDGDDVYILPVPAYKAACAMGAGTSDNLTTSSSTLHKFLYKDGLLASTSMHLKDKPRLTIRKSIKNEWERPLHFKKSVLFNTDDDDEKPTPVDGIDTGPIPSVLVDRVDRVDTALSNASLQAVSDDNVALSTNGSVSTRILSEVDTDEKITEKPVDSKQVQQLLTELQTTLDKRDRTGIKKFNWRDDMTEPWPRLGREEFIARVSAAIASNDEKLIHAAKVATLRTLGKYDERRGI